MFQHPIGRKNDERSWWCTKLNWQLEKIWCLSGTHAWLCCSEDAYLRKETIKYFYYRSEIIRTYLLIDSNATDTSQWDELNSICVVCRFSHLNNRRSSNFSFCERNKWIFLSCICCHHRCRPHRNWQCRL